MQNTKVKDIMATDPIMVKPEDSLQDAACMMKETDCGCLPVGTKDKVEGIITDRDIIVRAVCDKKDLETEKVSDYMTDKVFAVKETDTLEAAAKVMHKNGVGRVIVKDSKGSITGLLSFGRMLREGEDKDEVSNVVSCATGKEAA